VIKFDSSNPNDGLIGSDFVMLFVDDRSGRASKMKHIFESAAQALKVRDDAKKDTSRSLKFVHFDIKEGDNWDYLHFLNDDYDKKHFPDFMLLTPVTQIRLKFKMNKEKKQGIDKKEEGEDQGDVTKLMLNIN